MERGRTAPFRRREHWLATSRAVSRMGPMFCTSAAPRRTAPRAPGSGRLGITFHDSVTNAAGPGNDLLMMVSDEELLVASVGDEEAFAAFYRRNARPLAGFFMRRTGDAELAADLTAETFAAALASRRRFDPAKGPAIGWLYGIARHKLARTLEHGRAAASRVREARAACSADLVVGGGVGSAAGDDVAKDHFGVCRPSGSWCEVWVSGS